MAEIKGFLWRLDKNPNEVYGKSLLLDAVKEIKKMFMINELMERNKKQRG